jgi:broad specificity phosphatase PhoE
LLQGGDEPSAWTTARAPSRREGIVLEQKWPQTLWVVRHGQSAGNVARDAAELGGLTTIDIAHRDVDVPLSPLGEQQAEALGDWFTALPEDERPNVVLSSPYVRARQTADRVLRALQGRTAADAADATMTCIRDERLREKEFGILDRLTPLGIKAKYPELADQRAHVGKFYFRPPGGESWCDVILRLRSLLDMLTREYRGDRVLVVAHQVIVNCLRYLLERLDEDQILAIDRLGDVPQLRHHVVRLRCARRPARQARPAAREFRLAAARGGRAGDRRARPAGGAEIVKSDDVPTLDVEPRLLREWPLPQPDGGADKEARGSTLVIAGSAEMPGAACLAATSALRAGAGKMAVATVAGIAPGVALLLAEARVLALAQTDAGGIGAEAMSQIESRLAKVDAVLIGPGLLDGAATRSFTRRILKRATRAAVVIDALAMDVVLDVRRFERAPLLTPHAGEMAHLTGLAKDEIDADPGTPCARGRRCAGTPSSRSRDRRPTSRRPRATAGATPAARSASARRARATRSPASSSAWRRAAPARAGGGLGRRAARPRRPRPRRADGAARLPRPASCRPRSRR